MPDKETVTLKLPSGEEVDFIVPAGLSDNMVKAFVLSKRPDFFVSPTKPRLAGIPFPPAQPPAPTLGPSEEMPVSQAEQNARGNVRQTLGELGGPAATGLALAGGGAAVLPRAIPAAILGAKSVATWAAKPENRLTAYFIYHELDEHFHGLMKLIKGAPTGEEK